MRVSVWRLIHLWLAIISGVFVLLASITGAILAFEPVYELSHDYNVEDKRLTVSELIFNVSQVYEEVSSITKDHNGHYQISVFNENGEETFYINPANGERLGELIKTPEIFDFARTVHRSLFLKETGRFIVGLTCLLLVLIASAGVVLVVRKQGGLRLFYKKTISESFNQDYHTRLGKVFIWPILIVALTGTVLFFVRFDLVSAEVGNHNYSDERMGENASIGPSVFESTQLRDFKALVFPFTDFDDDYFELKLNDAEFLVNQKTGQVVSEVNYSNSKLLADFSFQWHTGEGQYWWSILLGVTSLSLVFFTYSGFAISLQRMKVKRGKWHNPFPQSACELVIAIGSEMGATADKAGALHRALLSAGRKSFITTLNEFKYEDSMKYLIAMSSTYGKGDAPANANRFIKSFGASMDQSDSFEYAVAGFGSRSYPDFCQYAIDLDGLLAKYAKANSMLKVATLEDHDKKAFGQWVNEIGEKLKTQLEVDWVEEEPSELEVIVKEKAFSPNPADRTFLLELSAKKSELNKLKSGDLLAITPEDGKKRYYSMAVNHRTSLISLSIKKHENGEVSNYLANTTIDETIKASFKQNPAFHFPDRASHVLLIANGTGIGPFLGMIAENTSKTPTTLFWGGQNQASFGLYQSRLKTFQEEGKLQDLKVAYSREGDGSKYVQDLVANNQEFITNLMEQDGSIMICGSLNMQKGVEKVLSEILEKRGRHSLDHYKERGIMKADCY